MLVGHPQAGMGRRDNEVQLLHVLAVMGRRPNDIRVAARVAVRGVILAHGARLALGEIGVTELPGFSFGVDGGQAYRFGVGFLGCLGFRDAAARSPDPDKGVFSDGQVMGTAPLVDGRPRQMSVVTVSGASVGRQLFVEPDFKIPRDHGVAIDRHAPWNPSGVPSKSA